LSKAYIMFTLSSTETEYSAVSEATKEVIFAKNILEMMGIWLNTPIKIKNWKMLEQSIYQRTIPLVKIQNILKFTGTLDGEEGMIITTFVRSGDKWSRHQIHQKRYSYITKAHSWKMSEQ
jgi:hypothetical protein